MVELTGRLVKIQLEWMSPEILMDCFKLAAWIKAVSTATVPPDISTQDS
jgi:hypothetical protein